MLSGLHALGATSWSTTSGNGSDDSLASTDWSRNDDHRITLPTTGYSGIAIQADQTSSATGPAKFDLNMSVDGGTSWATRCSSHTVLPDTGANTCSSTQYKSGFTVTEVATVSGDNRSMLLFRFVNRSSEGLGGTSRIDNILMTGTSLTPAPVPGPLPLLGVASAFAWSRRRRLRRCVLPRQRRA